MQGIYYKTAAEEVVDMRGAEFGKVRPKKKKKKKKKVTTN